MRILVTGGAGFIGSHSVERLVSAGHEVLAIDNLSAGRLENLDAVRGQIEFERIDIRRRSGLRRVFRGWSPDAVLHLAAIVSVTQSVLDPLETASVNLSGALEVLEAARLFGVRRFVAASSAAVYGRSPRLPSRETDPTEPASPYAAQKRAFEHCLAVYREVYGLETLALRYFNVYGSRQDPNSPYAGVVAGLQSCLAAARPFDVHGDGRQTRDFISVLDIAEVNERVIAQPALPALMLNVGTGRGTSVLDLVEVTSRIWGREVELVFVPGRLGDVRHSRASIARLRLAVRGFRPRALRPGLAEAFGASPAYALPPRVVQALH